MLSFIHGHHLALTIDTAVQLHHVADYYEVLPLRDGCCRFLLEALRPHNCCGLLMRSYAVNCEPLTQRCLDTLMLDFVAVVDCDPGFAELDAAALRSVIARDNLVCAEEGEVFEALLKWHAVRPAEKHAALLEMLPLVRWDFILGERRAELLAGRHLAGMRAAADALAPVGGAGWRGLSAEEDAGSAPRFTGCSATESGVEGAGGAYRSLGCEAEVRAGSPSRTTAAAQSAAAAAELDTPSWAEVLAGVKQYLAPQPPAQQDEAAERQVCRPRQNTWGTLVGRNPEPPSQPQLTQEMQLTWLESTKEYVIMQRLESRIEYVIGRSRKSTIRIGHNAPMPYISSHHFRVYNEIVHADSSSGGSSGGDGGGGGGTASLQGSCPSSQDVSQSASQGAPGGGPRLEAWLEDLSQNGTFVNGKLVGRDAKRKLQDGDRIELVFPQESQPGSPNNVNHFPTFTYQAPSPWGDLSLASGVQRTNAAPSPGGAASQSSSQE